MINYKANIHHQANKTFPANALPQTAFIQGISTKGNNTVTNLCFHCPVTKVFGDLDCFPVKEDHR